MKAPSHRWSLVTSLLLLIPVVAGFLPPVNPIATTTTTTRSSRQSSLSSSSSLVLLFLSAPADSDFEKPLPVVDDAAVDANVYNVPLEQAAELWLVSVVAENRLDRTAGVPFLETSSKDYFVDDVAVSVSRVDGNGLGLELLELAGGRDDGYGLTIVENASGNAQRAGVISGDSIGSVEIMTGDSAVDETQQTFDCECRDFDTTIGLLKSLPPDIETIVLNLKRIRRWPKINVVVEYPPVQCAKGADNKETLEFFAGENLRRALLNRGIAMEDPQAPKCDFCGGKCSVKVDMGMPLLSPMSSTEEKIMKNNPKCRISCKTVVGHNMQEGELRLKVNLNLWTATDKRASSPFASR